MTDKRLHLQILQGLICLCWTDVNLRVKEKLSAIYSVIMTLAHPRTGAHELQGKGGLNKAACQRHSQQERA